MAVVYSQIPAVVTKNSRGLAAWMALAAVLLAAGYALFADSLGFLWNSFQKPEFSHGYIVPLISAWIVWQRRRLIAARRGPGA